MGIKEDADMRDFLLQQKKKAHDKKMMQDQMNRMMADMDKTYDPRIIAEDAKRHRSENHEWFEKMKYVDKPKQFIERDRILETQRIGIHVSEIVNPIQGEVLIKLDKHKINSHLFECTTYAAPDTTTGIVVTINDNDRDKLEFSVGDRVVYNIKKNNVKKNKRRIFYNDSTHLLVPIYDVLGVY